MNQKYVLKLTADERDWLEGVVRTGKSAAWKIRHANAFLKMDRGEQGPASEDARIAEAFGMSTRSLENWLKQAVEEGPREVLERYYPTRPQCRKLDGQGEAQLVKLACLQAPERDADFACQMDQVLEVYCRPYEVRHPIICMDEQPKQLIDQVRMPVPAQLGAAAKEDFEYVRQGMCVVWMFFEPLAGWSAASVTLRKTTVDWAQQVREVVEAPRYAQPNGSRWYATTSMSTGWPRCMKRLHRKKRYG